MIEVEVANRSGAEVDEAGAVELVRQVPAAGVRRSISFARNSRWSLSA